MKKTLFMFVAALMFVGGFNTVKAQYVYDPPKVSSDLRATVDEYLKALEENPADENVMKQMEKNKGIKNNKEQQVAIGFEFLDRDLFSQAIGIARKITETDGNYVPALYLEAACWFKMGNPQAPKAYGNAAALYDQIKNNEPDNIIPYLYLVRVYRYINPEYAIELMEEIKTRSEGDAKIEQQLGTLYYQLADTTKAAEHYRKYFAEFPDGQGNLEVQKEYAILMFVTKNFETARDAANRFMDKAPKDDPVLPRILFRSNYSLEDAEATKAAYDKFYGTFKSDELQPSDLVFKARYLLNMAKEYEQAIPAYQEAAKADTTKAIEAQYGIYSAYNKMKDYANAIPALEKYLDMDKKNESSKDLFTLGRLYYNAAQKAGEDENAELQQKYVTDGDAVFTKFAELAKESHLGPMWRARINLLVSGNSPKAEIADFFKETLTRLEGKDSEYDATRAQANAYIAWYYAMEKNYTEAGKYANAALKYDEDNNTAKQIADFCNKLKK